MKRKWLWITGGVAIVAAIGAVLIVVLVVPSWPFREGEFRKRIESATGSKAQFSNFRQQFFPHPGCAVEQVTLTPTNPDHPTIKMQKLSVTGLYTGLIGKEKHLHAMEMEGLQVLLPVRKNKDEGLSGTSAFEGIRLDEAKAHDSEIVFASKQKDTSPKKFGVLDFEMHDVDSHDPVRFETTVRIPDPPGEVHFKGKLGPVAGEIGKMSLNGSFELKDADLSRFDGIAGTLAGKGDVQGTLEQLHVQGTTDTPDFTVTDTKHSVHLTTQYEAVVNATNGDVNLDRVKAQMEKTKLLVQGAIAKNDKGDHQANVDITSDDARIQDVLYLFMKTKPPLEGATKFRAKVQLPFNDQGFLQRVVMTAQFGIRDSKFTHPDTAEKVGELSESARGNPSDDTPPTVLTDLLGDVKLVQGVANFSQLHFRAPGVTAALHGKYSLESEKVDLHGTMSTDVKLSKATTGFKAFLMKVVEFAKSKKKEGATVPVSITGTYDKPSYSIDAPAEK